MWIEAKTDDFHIMSLKGMHHLSIVSVPYLSCFIEGACHNQISEWVVEGHGIDNILVFFEGKKLISCLCIPNFASSIIGTGNEFCAIFVESAVGQRQ